MNDKMQIKRITGFVRPAFLGHITWTFHYVEGSGFVLTCLNKLVLGPLNIAFQPRLGVLFNSQKQIKSH